MKDRSKQEKLSGDKPGQRTILSAVLCACLLAGCGASQDKIKQQWFDSRQFGNDYLSQQDYLKAEKELHTACHEAQRIEGNDLPVYISLADLAELYQEDGTYEQASVTLKKALDLYKSGIGKESDPLSYLRGVELVRCFLSLGVVCEREKHTAEAQDLYSKCTSLCQQNAISSPIGLPNHIVGYDWTMALCRLMESLTEDKKFTQAATVYSDSMNEGLGPIVPRALQARLQKDVSAVKDKAPSAVAGALPNNGSPLERKWFELIEKARAEFYNNDASSALEYYKSAATLALELGDKDGRQSKTYLELGRCYDKLGHWREAVDSFEKAAETSAKLNDVWLHETALFEAGQILTRQGKMKDAIVRARKRLDSLSNSEGSEECLARAWLGRLLLADQQNEEAERNLSQAAEGLKSTGLDKSWERGNILSYLAEARMRINMKQEAREALEEAVPLMASSASTPPDRLAYAEHMLAQLHGRLPGSSTAGGAP
jgi:tetratricopeptide (TPR) repeat protein